MNRRDFLKSMAAVGFSTVWPFPNQLWAHPNKKKALVLGIDGMDVNLTRAYVEKGHLPNVARLLDKGGLSSLRTTMPPQSPVAWSSVTVGASPAVHGIYDFIHRHPETKMPHLSTSQVHPPKRALHIGSYNIPLSSGQTELLRLGVPFWEPLERFDIPTTIFKMPANFPCKSKDVRMVSGLGTPDLRGGYGSYTLFTTKPGQYGDQLTGGIVVPVSFSRDRMDARLPGPENSLIKGKPATHIPVTVWRDRENPVVRIRLQDKELILKEGEWSGWQEISFPMLGFFLDVKGVCKIYVKSVRPEFNMYVSPINIDPADPSLPVASPESYGEKLAEEVGLFYTQGLPEDTKALSEGILSEEEYLELAHQIFNERRRLLQFELDRLSKLQTGMLFFYFSSLDQNTHMYWRMLDPNNPLYSPELASEYGDTVLKFYKEVDRVLGDVLDALDIKDPNTLLLVMSDHGFASFNRQVNVNTWLYKKGYLAMEGRPDMDGEGYFKGVNWSRTGVYNVGINCIYLNKKGREKRGIVTDGQAGRVLRMLAGELCELKDPETGQKAVTSTRIVSAKEHEAHPHAPDLIIGWNNGYRNSWKSILGGFEPSVFMDNTDKWSGDHCIDPALVPAILISNKRPANRQLGLCDIAPTILKHFGIEKPSSMSGRFIFNG